LKDNKHNIPHLARKYARLFVLGHIAVPQSSPLGTDNVRGQISQRIFSPNGGYCLYTLGDFAI